MTAPVFNIGVTDKDGQRLVFKLQHAEVPDVETAAGLTRGEYPDAKAILVLVPKGG